MKIKSISVLTALSASTMLMAQSVPTHNRYVDYGEFGKPNKHYNKYKSGLENERDFSIYDIGVSWMELLDSWEPGQPLSSKGDAYKDDNFFISRVRLKERFWNQNTQHNKSINKDTEKKLNWWAPIGDLTKTWGPLPRYNFESDNFSMWQYLDVQGNWSNSWFRVPGAFNDVAHKNGVTTGCLYFIDWAASVRENTYAGEPLAKLCEKDGNGNFKYARKLIQLLKYYGIDGIGINPEGSWSSTLNINFQDFLGECHRIAEEENWPFHVDWYAYVSNTGGLTDNGCTLSSSNSNWFHKNGNKITDTFFLNYNWTESSLSTSTNTATNLGRDPRDVYAGFDMQGRGFGKYGNAGWSVLAKYPISIVVWGAHDRSQLYAGSNEGGTADLSVQYEYLKKQELLFTGGSRNVLNTPSLTDANITSSLNSLAKFHGYSKFVTAKSTIQDLPFVTRFNLGNGMSFRKEGNVTFDHKWYNLGMQDYLPTWRWWIYDDMGNVPENAIECGFTFDDAWFGGSALKLSGATTKSNIRLFKTNLPITKNNVVSITYKVNSGTNPHMKLMFSEVGSEETFKAVTLPATEVRGDWYTYTCKVGNLVSGSGKIACIALSVENTTADYEVLIGELAVGENISANTVTPVIKHTEALRRIYNSVDAKVVFDMPFIGSRPAEYSGCPVYNDEVGAWYYEIYIKQEGFEPILLTATTSWAAYVIEATLSDPNDPYYYLGVRAVAPNGKDGSEIVWSEKMTSDLTPVETLAADKHIIKPNEEFSIGFVDPTHAPVKFEIINSATGEVVKTENNVNSLTTSLENVGCYDIRTTNQDGEVSISRGLVLITPEQTGRLPQIDAINASTTNPVGNQEVSLSFAGNDGTVFEGEPTTVSQGLFLTEPYQLCIDKAINSNYKDWTYALWVKVDKFNHAALGTLLMQKLNKNGGWTDGVWGEMYTVIRSASMSGANENEITVNVNAPRAGTAGYEHQYGIPDGCVSTGYSIIEGAWNHIAVTYRVADRRVSLYINGKQVFQRNSSWAPRTYNANFYVGSTSTNAAGLTGWVDELQIWEKELTPDEIIECMGGYSYIAPELLGYFDFEEVGTDENGMSYFPNLGSNSAVSKAYVTQWKTNSNDAFYDEAVTPTLSLGVPMIEGVREVKFESAKWLLTGASSVSVDADNTAKAVYNSNGQFPVSVTLSNSWGATTKTIPDYITVTGNATGLSKDEMLQNMLIYPNPFKETAHILFANTGRFVVDVFDTNGVKVSSRNYDAVEGEVAQLSFDAPQGLYYIIVMSDGKCVKSFKITKE